jgi:bifunctional non-homologous end joining protein LigD
MTVLHSIRRTCAFDPAVVAPSRDHEIQPSIPTGEPAGQDQADSPHDYTPSENSEGAQTKSLMHSTMQLARLSPPLTPPHPPAARMTSSSAEAPKATELPRIEPQRPIRAEQVPEGPSWVHEVELAGQRLLAYVTGEDVRLYSVDRESSGEDWTERLPTLAGELSAAGLAGSVIDGILCALDPDGRSSRASLEQALAEGRESELVFHAFDMPFSGGRDLRSAPLIERKRLLRDRLEQLPSSASVRSCEHVLGAGAKVFDRACELGLDGVISKRVDSVYEGRRSDAWIEVKCARRLSLVIGGFTAPHGSRRYLGALLVGSYDEDGRLIYRGKVGSGFCEDSLAQLRPQLEQLQRDRPAFSDPPVGSQARGVSWVEPMLGVEVEYGELTDKGKLRHARFKGLRDANCHTRDAGLTNGLHPRSAELTNGLHARGAESTAGESRRPLEPASGDSDTGAAAPRSASGLAMLCLTNADSLLFPALGLSKRDLADYVQQVAEKMLPHVRSRPLTLVRCPEGVDGERSLQCELSADSLPEGLACQRIVEGAGADFNCATVVDALGLLGLVQLNAIEVQVRGARIDKMDHPDRLLFDLDPDVGVEFAQVVEAAVELRDRLSEFGLTSFVKTSGGRGLHVVVPVQRRRAYAPVARFCRSLAERMVVAAPGRYALGGGKNERRGKITIVQGRNARQASMVAPYSVRARPDARVSMPLSWEELTGDRDLQPGAFDLVNVAARLTRLEPDPWAGFFELRQWITKASFRKIGINPDLRAAPSYAERAGAHPR